MIAFETVAGVFGVLDRVVFQRLPSKVRHFVYYNAFQIKGKMFPSSTRSHLTMSDGPTSWGIPRTGAAMSIPQWLEHDLSSMRLDVDSSLLRGAKIVPENVQRVYPSRPEAGRCYQSLLAQIPDNVTHLIFAPSLKRGGADLLTLKHLTMLIEAGSHPALILTEDTESTWLSRVPKGGAVIQAGERLNNLSEFDRCLVIVRLILQTDASVVHNISSYLLWQCLRYFGKAIAQKVNVYCSLYCDEGSAPEGFPRGYAHDYAMHCDAYIAGYISDNSQYLEMLTRRYGISESKLYFAYAPTESVVSTPPKTGVKRILWAGRLDRQKRPDLLLEIAQNMPEATFEVYGANVLHRDNSAHKGLKAQPNVIMHGAYDGFASLPTAEFSCFLYTSAWDGLPNVLLEAGARGMAVVASLVGGIGDLINIETGWPIEEGQGADAYVAALRDALRGDTGVRRGDSLRKNVRSRHTPANFASMIGSIPGYLPVKPSCDSK